MIEFISIFIGMALINNIVLFKFLGLCPFFGKTGKISASLSTGIMVSVVMLVASAVAWIINNYVLTPLGMQYLDIVMYMLVIVLVVQLADIVIKRTAKTFKNGIQRRGPSGKLDVDAVNQALVKTGGNKAKAARLLGVGRATLYRFFKDHPEIIKNG